MCSPKDEGFLSDIREAVHRIQDYTKHMQYADFLSDIKTQDAVIRNLEIIGEATKQLSEATRQQAPHIPWRNIARMRDKLVHHYFGVNLDIVWNVIQADLANLIVSVDTMLSTLIIASDSSSQKQPPNNGES